MGRSFHAWTVLSGATLLLLVQPLLGRRLLPWFGGSPAVWSTCLLFFQSLLLVGYALADRLARTAARRLDLLMLLEREQRKALRRELADAVQAIGHVMPYVSHARR